jgi:hypothetical protein
MQRVVNERGREGDGTSFRAQSNEMVRVERTCSSAGKRRWRVGEAEKPTVSRQSILGKPGGASPGERDRLFCG